MARGRYNGLVCTNQHYILVDKQHNNQLKQAHASACNIGTFSNSHAESIESLFLKEQVLT